MHARVLQLVLRILTLLQENGRSLPASRAVMSMGRLVAPPRQSVSSLVSGCSDEYLVIKEETLLPSAQAEPASYTGVNPVKLDRDSTIDDVCDFFLEYMQSDIVVRLVYFLPPLLPFTLSRNRAFSQINT